jgi:hypothetical protein
MKRVTTSFLLGAFAACATAGPTPEPENRPAGEIATPPFTAEEIRTATSEGRTYRFRIEQPGHVPMIREMRFSDVTDDGCTVEGQMFDEAGGVLGEPTVQQTTWEQLRGHAAYPKEATTIAEEPCSVPAGDFNCRVYTVRETRDGVATVTRAAFATALPGAPVHLTVTEGGAAATEWTLIEHRPGGRANP